MKRVEITYKERLEHEGNIEWWEYVRQKWVEAGFDMSKSVSQKFGVNADTIIFTQED